GTLDLASAAFSFMGAGAGAKAASKAMRMACGLSFTASTKVLLASGAAVAISNLKPGVKVLATNVKTGKTQAETVTDVMVDHDKNLYDLKVKTSHGTSVIHTTSNHPFWDATTHQWTVAGKLRHGDKLLSRAGAVTTVIGGSTPVVHDGWMWDLTIANDHDFYVDAAPVDASAPKADSTPVLVHNCGDGLKYVTYTKTNALTGEVYAGRTMGYGD